MTEETPDMASSRIAIGIDVGGSGIKAAVVDVESGRFRSERIRVATPSPSTPDAVLASVARVIKRLAKSSGLGDATPVGIGLYAHRNRVPDLPRTGAGAFSRVAGRLRGIFKEFF